MSLDWNALTRYPQVHATDVQRLLADMHDTRGERATDAATELHPHSHPVPEAQWPHPRAQHELTTR